MAKKTLLLQPIQGKFVQSFVHGKTIKVWLVNPKTNEKGTEIPYDDAIDVLALPHPVVCPAQIKGKDGKYIKILDEDDLKTIAERKDDFSKGVLTESVSTVSDNSSVNKLVETQAKLIESQAEQLKTMQSQFADMQKTMEKLLKKADKIPSQKHED